VFAPLRNFSSTAPAAIEKDVDPMVARNENASTNDSTQFTPTPQRKYRFFQNVEVTSEGVAIVRLDNREKKVNTLSFALSDEAKIMWNSDIHNNTDIKAVIFTSAKPDTFIAGADIFDIQQLEDKTQLLSYIERELQFFQRMKSKGVPLIAAIDGPALGGGLEWALWCDYRICTDNPKTKLGLPEVKLGLLPGFGGTQNLPALVGVQNAMDMMLTGKDIRPNKAKKMGLVDLVVAPQSLEKVAIHTAKGLVDGTVKKSKPKKKVASQSFY